MSGRSPGEGNGNPLQYSCLENSINRGAWEATVHRVSRVRHDLGTKPTTTYSKMPRYWGELYKSISRWENSRNSVRLYFWGGSKITADGDCSHEIKRRLLLGRKVMTNLDSIKKQRHYFANKGPSSQGYVFCNSHVWMWELDCEESWAPKNWCFWTVVLEKILESPMDCKEIQPVHSEGDQLWVFFGRNDAKAETPVLWPPHAKSWLIGKDSDSGRDWGQEEKGMTEDEMAVWHHRQWTWVWVNSRNWWWIGRPGV